MEATTRLRENDDKHKAELQKERDEVSWLKKELAQAEERRAKYIEAVTEDKRKLREDLEMAEVRASSATETCEALQANSARWLKELTRLNNEMDSKCLVSFSLSASSDQHLIICW